MHPHPHLPQAFAELGLDVALLKGLHKLNFDVPSDIQRELIPAVLQGRDVIGQAKTGTGKTAAFALPLLQRLNPDRRLQAVVLVPTRELATQVTAEFRRLGEFTPLQVVPIYGGQAIRHQMKILGRKTHIIVATPGRILDLMNRNLLAIHEVSYVVLDEVDRMLDIGFIDDIRKVLQKLPQSRQTVFVSATLTSEIKQLARQFMNQPLEVNVSQDELTVENIDQIYCSVEKWDKYRLLQIILQQENPKLAIVFTNTKHQARKLSQKLFQVGVNVKEIHGDLVQRKREKVMERFRRHQIQVLVATDLAARGIDVHNISHIINYDLPKDIEIYVHRIGRTARMGAFGKAITFVTREEGNRLTEIEKLINKQLRQVRYNGFEPRQLREEESPPKPTVLSRFDAPTFGTIPPDNAPTSAPRKTLGSKFRSSRRRR